jgi:hypothetical protein
LGEAFLLGHWKNYQELEENLSMPELIITLQAKNRKELEDRKFLASLQGVDLEESQETTSFDDVRRRALGINASADDVVSLQGTFANEAGFGIGAGLGYRRE